MKLTIGDNIRTLRRKADLTQEELAAQIGVSCQSVSRWEQGTTYPDMELLPVLAGLFGVTVDTLLGMPDIEKERKADEAFDALRRESMKAEIDPAAVIPLIREIRNNFIDCDGVWRLWTEGNYRCYRHPEILPEVRLLAEAYKKRHINDIHLVETMAYVEDEAHIDEFSKNTRCRMMRPKGRLRSTGIISFAIGKDLKKKDATVFIKRSAFFLRPIRCSTGRPNLRRRRARTRFGPACCVLYAAARGIGSICGFRTGLKSALRTRAGLRMRAMAPPRSNKSSRL